MVMVESSSCLLGKQSNTSRRNQSLRFGERRGTGEGINEARQHRPETQGWTVSWAEVRGVVHRVLLLQAFEIVHSEFFTILLED